MRTRRKSLSPPESLVKVVSYNVLSSHLSAPSYFKNCNPEFLDPQYRLTELYKKLDAEIEQNAVICLQEISTPWSGKLHTYFASKGYYYVAGLYGNKFNGYMGVGIAVPLKKYVIEEVNTTRIADNKRLPRKDKPVGFLVDVVAFFTKLANIFVTFFLALATLLRLYSAPPRKDELWDNVTYRHNQMVCLRLRHIDSDKVFVVGNYHMPCMFKLPSVMMAHCALSGQHIQRFAGECPYIFVGDFNIKPDSTMYRLMTEGQVESTNPEFPVNLEGDSWECSLKPFRSAYFVANGAEPNFTNYAQVQDDPVFVDTLDYIFVSEHWTVDRVLALPHRDEVQGPLPTETEPSDHILIAAHLNLDE